MNLFIRKNTARLIMAAGLTGLCFGAAPKVQAQTYDVAIDTSGLEGYSYGNDFTIDFALSQDPTTAPSEVSVSNFDFGTGTYVAGTTDYTNDASGDLSSSVEVSVDPTDTYSEFDEDFDPGSELTFTVDPSGLSTPSPIVQNDLFTFEIFDDNPSSPNYMGNIDTEDTNTSENALATFTLAGSGGLQVPPGFDYISPVNSDNYNVTVTQVIPAPEASSIIAFAAMIGLLGAGVFVGIRKKQLSA